jgi:hypothetical protein
MDIYKVIRMLKYITFIHIHADLTFDNEELDAELILIARVLHSLLGLLVRPSKVSIRDRTSWGSDIKVTEKVTVLSIVIHRKNQLLGRKLKLYI